MKQQVFFMQAICALFLTALSPTIGQAVDPHPDRLPYSERTKIAIQRPGQTARPIRLKSEAFLPAGTLAKNLLRSRAATPGADRTHAILRFAHQPGQERMAVLAAKGVQILQYLPENAFFASLPKEISALELEAAGVEWIGAVYPQDKYPPRIQSSGLGAWALRAGNTADL